MTSLWLISTPPPSISFSLPPLSNASYSTSFSLFLSFKVCAIQVKNTGKMYACKKLDKKLLKKKHGEQMALSEKETLERISSPFIVSLACAFDSKSHLCLVMNLMNGGDLRFHIYSVGMWGLATSRVVFYSAQMTCGVLHLHSINIVYWDLKPENVLLDDLGNCRLGNSDLGLAVQIQEGFPSAPRVGHRVREEGSRLFYYQGKQSLGLISSNFLFPKALMLSSCLSGVV